MPRFPYTRIVNPFAPAFHRIKNAPLLKIGILAGPTLMVKSLAYIDTGAQFCLFDNGYAAQLGIKDYKDVSPENILPLAGIGGMAPQNTAYFHDLKLVVFNDQTHLKLSQAWKIIETKIGFIEKPISFAGILGVYGFLDHFSLKVNIPDGYFELESLFD